VATDCRTQVTFKFDSKRGSIPSSHWPGAWPRVSTIHANWARSGFSKVMRRREDRIFHFEKTGPGGRRSSRVA